MHQLRRRDLRTAAECQKVPHANPPMQKPALTAQQRKAEFPAPSSILPMPMLMLMRPSSERESRKLPRAWHCTPLCDFCAHGSMAIRHSMSSLLSTLPSGHGTSHRHAANWDTSPLQPPETSLQLTFLHAWPFWGTHCTTFASNSSRSLSNLAGKYTLDMSSSPPGALATNSRGSC